MQFNQVISTLAFPLDVYDESGKEIVLVLQPSGIIARAGQNTVGLSPAVVDGVEIAVTGVWYAPVDGLPERRDGVFYVVSAMVSNRRSDRDDLLVCGPPVLDANNKTIGCKGLSVPFHPAAAFPEPRRFRERELVELIQQHTGRDSGWEARRLLPSLYDEAFDMGLISTEEMDLARENTVDDL